MYISFADLAKLKGVSRSAVSQKKKAGILNGAIDHVNGKVVLNKEEALRLWDTNMVPHESQLTKVSDKPRTPEVGKIDQEEIPDFNTSRSKREAMMARLAEIDVEEREKVLVPSADVESQWVQLVTIAKTKVLGIPTKAKQRIPDLDKNAMSLLDEIVLETLEDLSAQTV